MNTRYLSLLQTIAFVGVLVVNTLANTLPINGMNTGQVSALYPSFFTPAGFTFGIWSVIYLLLLIYVIAQWWMNTKPFFHELGKWFLISCVANGSWIIAWHFLFPGLALGIMLVLLYSLGRIFRLLHTEELSGRDWFLYKLPFDIYLSWICVATIANTSIWFIHLSWHGAPLAEETWTVVMLGVAALLSIVVTWRFKTVAFSTVTVWALYGIYVRWQGQDGTLISSTALILILVVTISAVYRTAKSKLLRRA